MVNKKVYRLFVKGKFVGEGTLSEISIQANIGLNTLYAHKNKTRANSHLFNFNELPDETDYALYYGDTFIDIGEKEELKKRYEITEKIWSFSTSPTARRRVSSRANSTAIIIERIEEDEWISISSRRMVKR